MRLVDIYRLGTVTQQQVTDIAPALRRLYIL